MSQYQYSFQRLALLNAGGYARAEIPLDEAVSLVGANNAGKTSLISALQFLLVINKNKMNFGDNSFDKSRAYYFKTNSSYILLEAHLPQTGIVVFGCVGVGASHDYEYFAYKGELNLEHYRLDDGSVVKQPELIAHLASKGITGYRFKQSDYQSIMYGGLASRQAGMPDFSVFRLENPADSHVYQQILTRTLRLDKLTSAAIKDSLMQIFKRELQEGDLDFREQWDKSFADYNLANEQYLAANKHIGLIEQLGKAQHSRLELRGKIIDWRVRVDIALAAWAEGFRLKKEELTASIAAIREERHVQAKYRDDWVLGQADLRQKIDVIRVESTRMKALAEKFALFNHRQQLQDNLNAAKRELESITSLIVTANASNVGAINREITKVESDIEQLRRYIENDGNVLSNAVLNSLGSNAQWRLSALLSDGARMLGAEHYTVDAGVLERHLTKDAAGWVDMPGLSINTSALPPMPVPKSVADCRIELAEDESKLTRLREQLKVAMQMEEAQEGKRTKERLCRSLEIELVEYDELTSWQMCSESREEALGQLMVALEEIAAKLASYNEVEALAEQRLQGVQRELLVLDDSNRKISEYSNRRIDARVEFNDLHLRKYLPWRGEADWAIDELPWRLNKYQEDCSGLLALNNELKDGLITLQRGGLTKYQYAGSEEQEIESIIAFSLVLDDERETLNNAARSAVVNVTGRLRVLRDNLMVFKNQMRGFNSLISRQKISDLTVFKIDIVDVPELVWAIEMLISAAEKSEQQETLALFNQAGDKLDNASLQKAKEILIKHGASGEKLNVGSLFTLSFVAAQRGEPVKAYKEADEAASNGTVLMIKLVTGMALLKLMQDKKQQMKGVCYLDEAANLDYVNQGGLIEVAESFGFTLIFASPSPLTTARYCIPVTHHNGANFVLRGNWQVLEPLTEDVA